MFNRNVLHSVLLAGVLMSGVASADSLFSLENLERERASFISTMSDLALSMDERQRKSKQIYRRMVDIERMVLRDERIASSDKLIVKKAFANYDLTFLAHASAESERDPYSHWLYALNITPDVISRSNAGAR